MLSFLRSVFSLVASPQEERCWSRVGANSTMSVRLACLHSEALRGGDKERRKRRGEKGRGARGSARRRGEEEGEEGG